jgi:hypothetical protein
LDASTIYEYIDAASHGIESLLKDALYGIKVVQVAVNGVCGTTEVAYCIDSGKVWWYVVVGFTEYKTDSGTGLSKCDRTGSANTYAEISI